jgi:hypothetical protein
MSDRTSILNRAKESVERGARWLLAMRQPDGSLRGGPQEGGAIGARRIDRQGWAKTAIQG